MFILRFIFGASEASAKIIYAASGVSFACATPPAASSPPATSQMTAMGTTTNEIHKNTLKVFTFDLKKIIHFRANKKPKQQPQQQQPKLTTKEGAGAKEKKNIYI